MDGPIEPSTDLAEQFQEGFPVAIFQVNVLPPVAPGRHMVEGAGEFDSEWAGHGKWDDVETGYLVVAWSTC